MTDVTCPRCGLSHPVTGDLLPVYRCGSKTYLVLRSRIGENAKGVFGMSSEEKVARALKSRFAHRVGSRG